MVEIEDFIGLAGPQIAAARTKWLPMSARRLRAFHRLPRNLRFEVALLTGRADLMRKLLRDRADPNKKISLGRRRVVPAMHVACAAGYVAMVGVLFEAGASLGGHPEDGGPTPLHVAAINKRDGVMKKLLSLGADVDAETTAFPEKTALLLAVFGRDEREGKRLKSAKILVDAGADVNLTMEVEGISVSVLQLVCLANWRQVARLLLENGADVEQRSGGPFFFTALQFVCLGDGQLDDPNGAKMASLLLEFGADAEATSEFSGGQTPLLDAITEDRPETLNVLLSSRKENLPDYDD